MLRCVELPSTDRKTSITVACISAVAGVAMLAALLLVAQLYLRTQPRWLREHIMESKRKQGPPKCKGTGEKVRPQAVPLGLLLNRLCWSLRSHVADAGDVNSQ